MQVEKHSFDFIPEEERHGSVKNLFNIWFSANMQITVLVFGALAVSLGLNVFWSLVAIVLGNLIGGVFMASHSAQGPKLGIPQMIQSRAQFGVIGAALPLIMVIILYLGSYAAGAILGAQAIHNAFPGISVSWALVLLGAVTFAITIFGYDLIHFIERYLAILFAIVFILATIVVVRMPLPAHSFAVGDFKPAIFMLVVSMMASFQMSYAPYVADYSRYLPTKVSSKATFGYSYGGSVISTIWMMGLGVLLTSAIPGFTDNAAGYIAHLFGPGFVSGMYVVIVFGIVGVNVLNLYGAFMSTTTTLSSFTNLKSNTKTRFWLVLAAAAGGTALSIFGQGNLMGYMEIFGKFIQYVMIPWSTINLVDFYFLRHGKYDIKDFFDMDGRYGKINWVAISSFLITAILEIPFMSTDVFEGPIAKALSGADFAWVIGLVIPFLLYYHPMKKKIHKEANITSLIHDNLQPHRKETQQ